MVIALALGVTLGSVSAASAGSGTTTRVSVDSQGNQANEESASAEPSVSADGRYVAFTSSASNLVASDTNGALDIFVHDRLTGVTERVSLGLEGAQANGESTEPSISADGRYVAFVSSASNLVPEDTDNRSDIFVFDRQAGTTERVSVDSQGNQGTGPRFGIENFEPSISADGRHVVFISTASNLVAGDTNGVEDAFVHDLETGVTERVDVNGAGEQVSGSAHISIYRPSISADGRYVDFTSDASNLVTGDTDGATDVFVRDRLSGSTERVSVAGDGSQENAASFGGEITPDGRYVVFGSDAYNFAPGDDNETSDIFIRDRQTGTTELVSTAVGGGTGNFFSTEPSVSSDGRYVAFESFASNLVGGDTNEQIDVFVHDRETGITERASVDSTGSQGDFLSSEAVMDADGNLVVFSSNATDLVPGDTNGDGDVDDIFVHELGPPEVSQEAPATVTGKAQYRGGQVTDSFNSDSGTLSSGSGTFSSVETTQTCDKFGHCGPTTGDQYEGTVDCVDASVVEGGFEATIGGALTKAIQFKHTLPDKYFFVTVFDSSTPGVPDRVGLVSPTETPGCATEFPPEFEVTTSEAFPGVTVTGAVAPQTRIVEFERFGTVTRETRPRIDFRSTVPRSTFQCRFDEEPFHSCSGAAVRPPAALSEGPHTFEVFATDRAGHADPTPAKASFEVDTTPPETTLEEGPSGLIDYNDPSFTFSTGEQSATFLCSLDGAEAQECFSPFAPGPLADGKHTITIRGRDRAHNVDPTPIKISLTVDTTAPATTITSSPTSPTKDATPKIKFASSEPGSTFLCRFDAEPFGPCTGPAGSVPPAALADGTHQFEVEAIDKAGNVDPTPAETSFVIDTTPPETSIVTGPGGEGSTATFEVLASDGTLECRLDSAEWAPCGSTVHYEGLEAGTHTFRVRARDEAGNVDPTPALVKFKVK
jgi:Tol biopolymer transport system component